MYEETQTLPQLHVGCCVPSHLFTCVLCCLLSLPQSACFRWWGLCRVMLHLMSGKELISCQDWDPLWQARRNKWLLELCWK